MSKYLPPEVIAEIRKADKIFDGEDIPIRAFTVSEYRNEINKTREENQLAPITHRQCYNRLCKLVDEYPHWHKGQHFKGQKWYFWCDEGNQPE